MTNNTDTARYLRDVMNIGISLPCVIAFVSFQRCEFNKLLKNFKLFAINIRFSPLNTEFRHI